MMFSCVNAYLTLYVFAFRDTNTNEIYSKYDQKEYNHKNKFYLCKSTIEVADYFDYEQNEQTHTRQHKNCI